MAKNMNMFLIFGKKMNKMQDYHDLYLNYHTLLLAAVFEKFRKNSLENYGICLSHFFSASSLSWDAMLKMTKIELELISDPDIYSLKKVKR